MSVKRKISQNDLRRFMSEHKRQKGDSRKKIESPLAKYLDDGTIKCVLCDSAVKNESIWAVHINSKAHKDNLARRKRGGSPIRIVEKAVAFKEPTASTSESNHVTPKKILVNSSSGSKESNEYKVPPVFKKPETIENGNDADLVAEETNRAAVVETSDLPEGFFDDPLEDARARKVEYRDPVEEEWERFQKEMKEETSFSERLMEDDSEAATAQRTIEEVDRQMDNWGRVLHLETKKSLLVEHRTHPLKTEPTSDSDDSDGTPIDEFLDWRNKQSFS